MQYLYLIKCQHLYKIGITNEIKQRLKFMSIGNPFPLEVLALYGFENVKDAEKSLHHRFDACRVQGEWFLLGSGHIDVFHEICQRLGGIANTKLPTPQTKARDMTVRDENWDYTAMFASGWRMEAHRSKEKEARSWRWVKGSYSNRVYAHGGRISDLPYSIKEMREIHKHLSRRRSVGNA